MCSTPRSCHVSPRQGENRDWLGPILTILKAADLDGMILMIDSLTHRSSYLSHGYSGIQGEPITWFEVDDRPQYFLHSEELLRCLVLEIGTVAIRDLDRSLQDEAAAWIKGGKLGNIGNNVGRGEVDPGVLRGSIRRLQNSMEEERRILVVEPITSDDVLREESDMCKTRYSQA